MLPRRAKPTIVRKCTMAGARSRSVTSLESDRSCDRPYRQVVLHPGQL